MATAEELGERLADMLALVDDLGGESKEVFRDAFIAATDAEGPLKVRYGADYLVQELDAAYL